MPENIPGAIFDVALHPGIINKAKGTITKNGWQNLSLNSTEILQFVVAEGQAFIPAKIKGETRGKDQFISSSLVVLDFDGTNSYQKIINDPWIKKHGCFAYTTHSHKPSEEKDYFRLAIGLDKKIDSSKEYESIIRALIKRFDSDPACSDSTRMYFGNTESKDTWINETPIPLPIEDLVLSSDEQRQKSINWSQRDRDVAVNCLKWIQPREEKGSGTYPDAIRTVFGLINTFGRDETIRIITEANWEGNWDLEKLLDGIEKNPAKNEPCKLGTVINIANKYGMNKQETLKEPIKERINSYTNACERIASLMLTGDENDWAEIDLLTSQTAVRFSMPMNKVTQRVGQLSGKLLGIDISGECVSHNYDESEDWESLEGEGTTTKFLVPGVIKENGSALLFSAGGVGKTEMACAIAKSIAEGEGFLHNSDIPCEGGKRTLFIEADMEVGALATLRDYFINAGIDPDEVVNWMQSWVKCWVSNPQKNIGAWNASLKGLRTLKETLSTHKYDLVIIDSLKKVTAGTGFRYDKNEEMMLLMRLLTGIITPYSSLLILHHSNKADSLGMNSIGGASAIGEIVDSVHKLSRKDEHDDESNYTFETIKIRNGYQSCKFNYSRDDNGNYYVQKNDPTSSKQGLAQRILCLLERYSKEGQSNGVLRASELSKRLGEKRGTVNNKLTSLSATTPKYIRRKGRGW